MNDGPPTKAEIGRKSVARGGLLRTTDLGSYPERLLLVIVLCGATSIVPPRRRVAVGSVIVKLDNSGMFL